MWILTDQRLINLDNGNAIITQFTEDTPEWTTGKGFECEVRLISATGAVIYEGTPLPAYDCVTLYQGTEVECDNYVERLATDLGAIIKREKGTATVEPSLEKPNFDVMFQEDEIPY